MRSRGCACVRAVPVLGGVSVLVNANEPGGVTLSRLHLQRSLLTRESVTLRCLQSVFKGFGRGITHPTLTRRHKRKSLQHISLRVRHDVHLPQCFQWAWGGGGGQGVSPSMAMAMAVPGRLPQAPPVGTGSAAPRCLWGAELCCRGRTAANERLPGGTASRVPAHRSALPAQGASPGGSSLHPTEQTPLCGLPGAWGPSHPVLGRLCSHVNGIYLKIISKDDK